MPLTLEHTAGRFPWKLIVRLGDDILPLPDGGFRTKREAQAALALLLPLGHWDRVMRFTPKQLAQVTFALASTPRSQDLRRTTALMFGHAEEPPCPAP